MASSKVMASTSPTNPDLPRQSSSSSSIRHHSSSSHQQLHLQPSNDHTRNFGSMNMEEILKTMYSDSDAFPSVSVADDGGGGVAAVDGGGGGKGKTADEVWREIVSGGGVGVGGGERESNMTLEDYLTKAGVAPVVEEDVRVAPAAYGVETMMNSVQFQPGVHMQNGAPLGFANGIVAVGGVGSGGVGGGRGKRRAVEVAPLDKATQQKQKRMIKNRESAARSRERKQAYTVELESLVTQLEEENARLVKEEAELNKQRFKQLMENLIPVVEQRRPPRVLRRVNSNIW